MKAQKQEHIPVRSMKDRRYARISLDKIVVVNSRERDQRQFDKNVKSIETVGLLKPVVVNERYKEKAGNYELVCGEGRVIAFKRMGKEEIEAEVVDVDRKQAHLMSLIENIARVPPGTLWFANEVRRMRDSGMPLSEISKITDMGESYLSSYIRLAEKGEERLLRGVEHGLFPMTFARRVAEAGGAEIQNILMDAYDSDVITTSNFTSVKKILTSRLRQRPDGKAIRGTPNARKIQYTMTQLRRDITRVTRDKETYVKEAERRESRLFAMVGALESLWNDKDFIKLLEVEALAERPLLAVAYGSWPTTATRHAEGAADGQADGSEGR